MNPSPDGIQIPSTGMGKTVWAAWLLVVVNPNQVLSSQQRHLSNEILDWPPHLPTQDSHLGQMVVSLAKKVEMPGDGGLEVV